MSSTIKNKIVAALAIAAFVFSGSIPAFAQSSKHKSSRKGKQVTAQLTMEPTQPAGWKSPDTAKLYPDTCADRSSEPYVSRYPDIPIIDAHTHAAGKCSTVKSYLRVSEIIKKEYHSDLACWINLDKWVDPITSVDSIVKASDCRMLCSFGDYDVHIYTAREIAQKKKEGYLGCKFWFGPYYRRMTDSTHLIKYIDDPRLATMFKAMEKSGMPMTSLHIADPNGPFSDRGEWCADPVFFWGQIRSLENVVRKYPKLTFVIAHGAWLNNQDAQLDYMRYLLDTYPNLYIDIAATFQYYRLLDRNNLRDFMIRYADRIIYGTDVSDESEGDPEGIAARYARTFRILETADTVKGGGFFSGADVKGLNLPRVVLERIYYKNVLRIYSLSLKDGKLIMEK
ncbi:MAG: amidohydrolase [Bacteroidales bacterium]|jgi:hypothetical protein|nr:amidohydrolase [Bacteroidales bacterium]MCI2121759.1 amidohydrolase [Bacteroidales bacterium]MCI2145900.1 amidohydrolase [Bacteroidales bacterium]